MSNLFHDILNVIFSVKNLGEGNCGGGTPTECSRV